MQASIIGALVASRVEVGGSSAVAEPSYRYTTPIETPAPQAPAAAAPATEPARATTEDDVPFPELEELAAPKQADRIAEPKAAAPKAKPRPKAKPQQRRQAPPRPTTTEDLYDIR